MSRPPPAIAPNVDREIESPAWRCRSTSTPDDTIVRVGRTVIGEAREWNAKKKEGRAYELPAPGEHIVRLIKDGMRE